MRDNQARFYPESRIGGFTDVDGTIVFFTRVNSLLSPDSTVLDVGCGRGAHKEDQVRTRRDLQVLKGKARKVIGIDVAESARANPFIDEFRKIEGIDWPVPDCSIDLILCDNVLEHIEDPDDFFSEAYRVLRHDGYLCIRTANAWSYISTCARLIPNKYHSRVTRVVQDTRKEADVFPTLYKCNTVFRIRAMMRKHGFESVVYGYEAEPRYLSFSTIAYCLGVLHQRIAPGFLRPALFAFGRARKQTAP